MSKQLLVVNKGDAAAAIGIERILVITGTVLRVMFMPCWKGDARAQR